MVVLQRRLLLRRGFGSFAAADSRQEHLHFGERPNARSISCPYDLFTIPFVYGWKRNRISLIISHIAWIN